MKIGNHQPRSNAEITFQEFAIALIPPISAAIICGWLIGYFLFSRDALAGTTLAVTIGLIGVYFRQLRMMFECKGTWFGDWDPSKVPTETVSPLDEEKAFLEMIEEEG